MSPNKAKTVDLVRRLFLEANLHEPVLLAEAVCVTPERVRQILRDLKLHTPRRSLREAIEHIPQDLLAELEQLWQDRKTLRLRNETSADVNETS